MENRSLPSVFTVTTTADAGSGSLRQAILDANGSPGSNTITFDIGGGGRQTIYPTVGLPAITRPVTINGTTQPGFAGSPLIELNGSLTHDSSPGLQISAGNSAVRGLVINHFTSGINLDTSGNDRITGNYIGTDATGTIAMGNAYSAMTIQDGSNNTIGGVTPADRNVISGNGGGALYFYATTTGNVVEGNYIGTDVSGTQPLPNIGEGVSLVGAQNNTIGGPAAGAGNVISGNAYDGILIQGAGATGNVVQGNYIGTDGSGTQPLPNLGEGVFIASGPSGTVIGGTAPGARNVISGNVYDGLAIVSGASGTVVQGNHIGTDVTGTQPLGNGGQGIFVTGAGPNLIGGTAAGAGNIIAGNAGNGILVQGADTTGNMVQGNYIGTDVTGTQPLPNLGEGVLISAGPFGTVIGGAAPGAGNVISGNTYDGVAVFSGASGTVVQGNDIGTDVTGTQPLGNGGEGVLLSGTQSNTIGGTAAGTGNVIAANGSNGVLIQNADTTGNVVQGNYIGTDDSGTQPLPNLGEGVLITTGASGTVIGGAAPGARNVISANANDGLAIVSGASGTVVQGNDIGTDVTGTRPLGNGGQGIFLTGVGPNNLIGGTAAGAGNVIAANGGDGMNVLNASGLVVQGNYIGTDVTGTQPLGNGACGIEIWTGSDQNTIGGTAAGARNVIAANADGISIYANSTDNLVQGNFIGTDSTGTVALGNSDSGVHLFLGGQNNMIGGTVTGAANVISGNGYGVLIEDPDTTANLVQGNHIGTDVTGTQPLGNAEGIGFQSATHGNTIGGAGAGAGNVISGNTGDGILFDAGATGNVVQGNYIGTDVTGTQPLGNGGQGVISVGAGGNTFGGTVAGTGNVISANAQNGIFLLGDGTTGNVVQGNYIGTDVTGTRPLGNGGEGVNLYSGADDNLIGGTGAGAGNVIAYSGDNGVVVDDATGNAIRGNTIFASGNLGIELYNANRNQAFPVLTSAVSSAGSTVITGTLTSTPNTQFALEFFANTVCNPSGFGEGENFLMPPLMVMTNATGRATFTFVVPFAVPAGQFISATATDPSGDTSQFARCVQVAGATTPGPSGDIRRGGRNGSVAFPPSIAALLHPAQTRLVGSADNAFSGQASGLGAGVRIAPGDPAEWGIGPKPRAAGKDELDAFFAAHHDQMDPEDWSAFMPAQI